jgi:hypothetical protein
MGCAPQLLKSMMESRRCPNPTGPTMYLPSPSGPRCAILSSIRPMRFGSTGCCLSRQIFPEIPHIFLINSNATRRNRLISSWLNQAALVVFARNTHSTGETIVNRQKLGLKHDAGGPSVGGTSGAVFNVNKANDPVPQ